MRTISRMSCASLTLKDCGDAIFGCWKQCWWTDNDTWKQRHHFKTLQEPVDRIKLSTRDITQTLCIYRTFRGLHYHNAKWKQGLYFRPWHFMIGAVVRVSSSLVVKLGEMVDVCNPCRCRLPPHQIRFHVWGSYRVLSWPSSTHS